MGAVGAASADERRAGRSVEESPQGDQRHLFRQRTGIPWRDLPARFGKWKTVHDRHRRWSGDGTWEKILRAVQADTDVDGRIDWSMVSVDSTSCRAHQQAAGARAAAPRIPGRPGHPVEHRSDEALGRSRGGLTCKIHLASEGGRRPLAFLLTPGQWGDAPQMIPTLERIRVPRTSGGRRARALITWAATKRTHPVRTAGICGGVRSSTPFPSAWTSGPIASDVAARALGLPALTSRSTNAATK